MEHSRVIFLLPNVAGAVLPLDDGIIAHYKALWRSLRSQLDLNLDRLQNGEVDASACKPDVK